MLLLLARMCSSFVGPGKNLSLVVSSLRADTVAAKGLGISRRRVWECWLEGGLSLNGQSVKKHSVQVGVGDSVEVRGAHTCGRVVVNEIAGRTKKGGYHIEIVRHKRFSSSSSTNNNNNKNDTIL